MLEESLKELEQEVENRRVIQAELITCILNTPHAAPKDGKYLWQVSDFMPDSKNKPKHTVAEYMAAWEQFIAGCKSR